MQNYFPINVVSNLNPYIMQMNFPDCEQFADSSVMCQLMIDVRKLKTVLLSLKPLVEHLMPLSECDPARPNDIELNECHVESEPVGE